jgi:hypothetical protein
MAQDVPPDEVLTELGRLIWSAITLESVVYSVCRSIKNRSLFDDDAIGTRIDQALKDILTHPDGDLRHRASAWLDEAKGALEQRNHVVHSDPSTYVSIAEDGSTVTSPDSYLVHFPRKRSLPMVDTPLSVAGLKPIRQRLEQAYEGWIELSASSLWQL